MGHGPGTDVAGERDDAGELDDAGEADEPRDEDRRHLDAAIAMVAAGPSRWVMVCGIRDATDLALRATPRRTRVSVRAISPTSILVARADPVPEPQASRSPERRFRARLAHVVHVVASVLR